MDLNIFKQDQIIHLLSVHMMNKILKIINWWMNYLTKTNKTRKIQKKGRHFSKLWWKFISKTIFWYTLKNIRAIDEKINEEQKYCMNINRPDKWELSQSIPLRYLLSAHHYLPLSNMENKMVTNEKVKKTIYQFQVGYMLNPELNKLRLIW